MSMSVQEKMCGTCPFRKGSPHAVLCEYLTEASYRETRICHSTGVNAICETTAPEKICRGSRDVQLEFFHAIGFLPEPTDAAWEAKWRSMNGDKNERA